MLTEACCVRVRNVSGGATASPPPPPPPPPGEQQRFLYLDSSSVAWLISETGITELDACAHAEVIAVPVSATSGRRHRARGHILYTYLYFFESVRASCACAGCWGHLGTVGVGSIARHLVV